MSEDSSEREILLSKWLVQSPAPETDLGKLVEEFVSDKTQAEQKYQGKTLKLTGVVKKERRWMKIVATANGKQVLVLCQAINEVDVRPGDLVTVLAGGVDFISFGADTEPYVSLKFDRLLAVSR